MSTVARRSTIVCLVAALLSGCAQVGPWAENYKRLCETEAGFKVFESLASQNSILSRGYWENTGPIGDPLRLSWAGCSGYCQHWLKQGVFDVVEAEVERTSYSPMLYLVPEGIRRATYAAGLKRYYLRYSLGAAGEPDCVSTDDKNPTVCIKATAIDQPQSKYVHVTSSYPVGGADGSSVRKREEVVRRLADNSVAASLNSFILTTRRFPDSRTQICPSSTPFMPMEQLKKT